MSDASENNYYVKLCRFGSRAVGNPNKSKMNKNFQVSLKRDLNFVQLGIHPREVKGAAIFFSIVALILLIIIDFLVFFPFFNIPVEIDGNTYNKYDKNLDGTNDLVQDIQPVVDVSYDRFGMETDRETVGYFGKISYSKVFIFIMCPTILVPMLSYLNIVSYPGRHANRLKIRTLTSAPQTISFLSMSLRLTPSLETAVGFTSDNIGGQMKRSLRKILWDVYMNVYSTVEEAFIRFADEWGKMNGSFKHSLYLLRASLLERTNEGRRQALEKANSVIMTGVKLEVGNYANSLKGPTMLMFSFGILIPIIIATMLPITGIGKNSVFGIILVMDVFLPIALLLYARRILFNRPVFNFNMVSNDVGKKKQTNSIKRLLFFSASILLSIPGILIYLGYFPALQPRFGALIILLAASGGPALFILTSTRDSRKRRKLIAQMDREFPDALFQLGMCISEGASLEHGLESTGEVLKGTKISGLFLGLISRIRFEQNSLRALLEDRDALGLDMSDTIYATLNVVVSAVEKNSNDAGEIMIDISNYLRDLRTMDEMLRQKLSELLGTIKQTGMIFAPLIIGLTTAMYFKLNDNLAGIEFSGGIGFGSIGTTEPIAGEAFILIFGVFLLLTFSVIVYFITGLEYGGNTGIFKEEFGKGAIIAMSIFSASCIMGFKFFGV